MSTEFKEKENIPNIQNIESDMKRAEEPELELKYLIFLQ